MPERYDDEEYYPLSDVSHSPPMVIRHFTDFVKEYPYADYVGKFRMRVENESLTARQRPKLSQNEFESLKDKF